MPHSAVRVGPTRPPFDLPWVACDLAMRYPWSLRINDVRFLEAVYQAGGWDRLHAGWRSLLARGLKEGGWLEPMQFPLGERAVWPIRDAVDRERARRGYGPGSGAWFPADTCVCLRAMIRRRRGDQPGRYTASAVVPWLMAGLAHRVWVSNSQVRRLDIRCEPGRRGQRQDLVIVRVEECAERDWPEWCLGPEIYRGEYSPLDD